jgi:hypothetical protein
MNFQTFGQRNYEVVPFLGKVFISTIDAVKPLFKTSSGGKRLANKTPWHGNCKGEFR